MPTTARHCLVCGISLAGQHPRAKLCSDTCRTEAARARALQYRADNIEAVRAKDRDRARSFREKNPELSRLRVKRAMSKPKGKAKARFRAWKYYWQDPQKFRQKTQNYYSRNPEKLREQNARRDREQLRISAHEYRLRNHDLCLNRKRIYRIENVDECRRASRERARKRDAAVSAMRELGLVPVGLSREEIWYAVRELDLI